MGSENLTERNVISLPGGVGYVFSTGECFPVFTKSRIVYDEREQSRKWKMGLSITSGCIVRCEYCYTQDLHHFYPLSSEQIVEQVVHAYERKIGEYDQLKIEFKNMGDPLVNTRGVLDALKELRKLFPFALYSISTSGPNDPAFSNPEKFFRQLKEIREGGLDIRLQFSCQSTSNKDRTRLHPHIPMLTLEEIAEQTNKWFDGKNKVTLTFVPFKGYELSADSLASVFDNKNVFVKIAYVAKNKVTMRKGLEEADEKTISQFMTGLDEKGFLHETKPKRIY